MADTIRYCTNCQKNVVAKTKINWLIFIILLILGIVLGIVYLAYCFVSSTHKKCPECGAMGVALQPPKTDKVDTEKKE